jgi:hypothetical protein
MIRLIAVASFALAVATSAEAMTPAPIHQQGGMVTQIARLDKAGKCAECTMPGVACLKIGEMEITGAVPEPGSAMQTLQSNCLK